MGSVVQVIIKLYATIYIMHSLFILNFRSNSNANDLIKVSYVGVNNVDLAAVSSMVTIAL